MEFAFTDDQLAFRDAVRDLFSRECPSSVVREAWTNDTGRTKGLWAQLGEMGVLGALAPESRGGLGLRVLDVVLLIEESGYVALPEPLVEHALVALGDEELVPSALASLAVTGDSTVTTSPTLTVPYAHSADAMLLEDDGVLYLVAPGDAVIEAITSVDGSRRLCRVDFPRTAGQEITAPGARAAGFDRGALGAAAQLVGLTRRMLDMTVEYVSERQQFGVPIGSFQAVKHHLADARIALEFARPLVYRAAWSISEGETDASTNVSMAKAASSDAAMLTARKALQCHGAIGYSFEYDLHLFMKRAWALAGAWGDVAFHRDRVGRAIL